MRGPGSVTRLLFQVVLLAALLVGLSRLAGRTGKPDAGAGDPVRPEATLPAPQPPDEMSSAAPDLTFYRSLGKERPAPGGGSANGGTDSNNNDKPSGRQTGSFSAPRGAYLVQALSTRDAQAAKRLRDSLAGRGFPASVTEDRPGGQPVYRVRVGRYRTRPEAEAAARVLRQKYRLSPWILQEAE